MEMISRVIMKMLKVSVIVCVFLSVGALLYYAQKYVKSSEPVVVGPVELMNVPEWVGNQLKAKILDAAGGENLQLDENAAKTVAANLASVAWLDNVSTLTTEKSIKVYAKYRKPIALIESGSSKFYVDKEMVVLDYVPLPQLLIVEIKGISLERDVPHYGQVWKRDDLAAAVAIREIIYAMDQSVSPKRPLLREIAGIDVSNYDGRKNSRQPHITLYTRGNTTIIWGAEVGRWQQYLESMDEQKLNKLFSYYTEHKTLSTGVKYINLCDPRDNIPLPIDKY
jgi:hypothetical protein